MKKYLSYNKEYQSDYIRLVLLMVSISFIVFAVIVSPPKELIQGYISILFSVSGLITDFISVGGIGATFLNSGIVMLFSMLLIHLSKLPYKGVGIAAFFLMGGFALFGKTIINIVPIILGVFIYSKYQREPFSKYIFIAFFGTTLAPFVSEFINILSGSLFAKFILVLLLGVFIGFLIPPIASYTLRIHQGYNLYNVGFACGIIGTAFASVLKSLGHVTKTNLIWSDGNNYILGTFLFSLFVVLLIIGFLWNGKSFKGYRRLLRHSGRSVADFVVLDDLPVTLINIAILGMFATSYILCIDAPLNGPTIGGILAIAGFGAFGKHLKNIIPIILGVILASFIKVWNLTDPSVLLATLFSTGLAPIAGQFGAGFGILAGVIHSSVVLNIGSINSGLNLYNNGFSAGLVCIILLPVIEAIKSKESDE